MQIFVLDENKKTKYIFNSNSHNKFFNDKYYSELSTGAETLELSFIVSEDNDFVKEGCYLLFMFHDKLKMFQIKTCADESIGNTIVRTINTEFISLNLLNSYIRPMIIDGNVNTFLRTILGDTIYKVGYVSPSLTDLQTVTVSEISSVYSILQNNINTFGNIEYEFEVKEINSIKGQYEFYINVYADGERGNRTYKRFEDGKNIISLKRTNDITEKCAGLIAEGANGVTFKNIEWFISHGQPLDKPLGDDFLIDPELAKQYTDVNGKPILSSFKSNTSVPVDLLYETYNKLQEIKNTKSTYEVKVEVNSNELDDINIGDTVYIISNKFTPIINQKARIDTITISFTNKTCDLTFSNFKEVKSKIATWSKNKVIKDTMDLLINHIGKLTQSDIDKIKQYLAELNIQSQEIDNIIKKYEEAILDTVKLKTDITDDSEDYRAIKLDSCDNGLWIGDERIYDLKKNNCATIHTEKEITTSTTVPANAEVSTKKSIEYKDAVEYYKNFDLGKYANSSSLSKLISKNNSYKISTMTNYWAKKFGLDPYLIYALMMAESSGNPYCATKSSAGGYGIMQCERGAYFGHKQTIKFLDGSTKSFTPSYSTMTPKKGGSTTINGVTVDKNINNQIMFGCHELRTSLVRFKYNIFASLMGYNFGLYGADWVICKYVAVKNGYSFVNKYGYTCQSSKVQKAYFAELENMKCRWSSYRKVYQNTFHAGTWWYIEAVLRWYKVVDGQLPYTLDSNGNKHGYGANKTCTTTTKTNTTVKTGVATDIRNKIVAKAREIVDLHVKYRKATYDQSHRIVDDSKRHKWYGTHYGIKDPWCYDCSSLVSCAYKCVGLTSVYDKACSSGTLVASATSKSGYKLWKASKDNIEKYALPGDIIMMCNSSVPSTPNKKQSTHHTMIYCGKVNGVHYVAHARDWKYPPNAIMYMPVYSSIYTYGMLLRPWDLAKKDSEATKVITSKSETTTVTKTTTTIVDTNELNLKGLPMASPSDFYNDNSLVTNISINNVEENDIYPTKVSYVFLHFGIHDLSQSAIDNYQSLIKVLLIKYPKKPIFIAKEIYVDSRYGDNYEDINTQITAYNDAMKDFCNRNKYVIQVGVPSAILDSNKKYLNQSYSTNGWEMKDANSCQAYYKAYKKAILVLATGGSVSSTSISSSLCLHTENVYKYTKPMKSIEFTLPSKPDDTYYSRLIFTTNKNSEPTKYKQSPLVYLEGTNCKNGVLIPKADTTYTISVYYNPDTEIASTKYLGSVTGVCKGGKYATFSKFKYADTLVKNAKTFYDKRDTFSYNSVTPADFDNPAENISKWKVDNKMQIDDSCFLNYVLMGYTYSYSPYGNNAKTNNRKNPNCCWALPSTRNEANIAKYFVERGWIFDEADLTTYSNLQLGDIIFMDSDKKNNGEYMAISHTAIYVGKDSDGDPQVLECGNNSSPFRYYKMKNLKNILIIGRIRID